MRCEQFVVLAQALGVPLQLALPVGVAPREPMLVPAGRWMLGSQPGGFVFDVEKWAHEVDVPEFEIDAQPVNWAQYVEFVDDGGYDRPRVLAAPGLGVARAGGRTGKAGAAPDMSSRSARPAAR